MGQPYLIKPVTATAQGLTKKQPLPSSTASLPINFNPFANKDTAFGQSTAGVDFGSLNKSQLKNLRKNNREEKRDARKDAIGQEFKDSGGTAGLITSLGSMGAGVASGLAGKDAAGVGQMAGAALGNLPVVGKYVQVAQAVGSFAGNATGVESAKLTGEDADALNLSKTASFVNGLGETFGLNALAGKIGGTTKTFAMNDQVKGLGTAYDLSKFQAAENASGKGILLGKNKINASINKMQSMANIYSSVAEQSNLAKQNDVTPLENQTTSLYSGHRPGLISVVEKGGELKTAKSLIKQWKTRPKRMQLGGKMNMLPVGALHAHKHHLEDVNPNLEGEITSKGIPVVALDESGNVTQQFAEIERQEIVFTKEVTAQLETFWEDWKESKNDDIAIECGKFLVEQILRNTDDPNKTIANA